MTSCSIFVNNKYQKLKESMGAELDEMLGDIEELRVRSRTPESFKKKVTQYIKDVSEETMLNEREQIRQIAKREHNLKRMADPGYRGNHAEALASLLRTTNYNVKHGSMSVESVMGSFQKKYNTMLEQSLTEGEMKALASKGMDRDIIKYLASGGKADVPDAVKKVGDLFRKFQDKIYADKKASGIEVNYRENYAVNQRDIYNVNKMETEFTKTSWAELVHSRLDVEKTFPLMPDKAEQMKYLEDVYDGFVQRAKDVEAVDFNNIPKDLIKSSIQRKNLKPRTMHFTEDGLASMWEEFADKSVLDAMVADGARAARDIGVYEVLGPNGQNEFNTLKQKTIRNIQQEIRSTTDEKLKTKLQKQIEDINSRSKGSLYNFEGDYESLWANINGTTDHVGGKTLANAAQNLRSLTSMQVLGGSMFTALTDIFNGVTALNMATGQGYFKSMGDVGMGLLKTFPPGEQKRIAGMTNIALETAMGNILRGANSEGVTKAINNMNYWYSKVNPIAAQGRFHRVAATMMFGMRMADKISASWKDMDVHVKKTLERAGINEVDLEALRATSVEVKDGHNIISPTAISNITDDQAKAAIAARKAIDPSFWATKPDEYRAHLARRMDVMFDEFGNFAAPNPGLRERAFLHGATNKGTYGGEFLRTIAMLKAFTVKQASIMQKIYMNSDTKAGKVQHLSAQTLGLMGMGYVALSLKAVAMGETPPDPSNPQTMKRIALQSGAFGYIGDTLLHEGGRGAGPTVAFIGGPVASKVDQFTATAKKLITGEGSLKSLGELADFVPGNNLHALKMGMAYTVLDDFKEASSPGHKERMRKRRREAEGLMWQPKKISDI
jgi:hypothetical protein